MAKEILELEVRSNIKGAVKDMDALGKSVDKTSFAETELNANIQLQNQFIADQEVELARLKEIQDSIPKGAWHAGQHQLADDIREVTSSLRTEKAALKKLKTEQKSITKAIRANTVAQKKNTNAAIRGIQHFQIMGVSIRKLKFMVRGVRPMFKLLFGTIRTGIRSTGIGVLLLALISIGVSMKKSVAGGKAFKAMMAGIGAVVKVVSDALVFIGDTILSVFGFDSTPAVDNVKNLEKAYEDLGREMDKIALKEAKNKIGKFENQQVIDDITKTEKERLAASKENAETDAKTTTDRIAQLEEILKKSEKNLVQAQKAHKHERAMALERDNWNMVATDSESAFSKTLIALQEITKKQGETEQKLAAQRLKVRTDDKKYGDERLVILSTDVKKTEEASEKRKEIRDKAAEDEITLLRQLENIKNELAYRELKTVEEVEKAKLKTANDAAKKEIENSTASKTTKDLLLLELDEKYQSDLGIITKKFQDKKDLETKKSEEILKSLKATNIEDETEQALAELQIQKDKEDESLKSLENYLELKIELDKKYDEKEEEIEDAAIEKQKAKDKELADFKKSLRDEGLALIGKALDIQAATIEKNYNEEIKLAEENGQSTEGIEKKYDDKRAKNAEKQKALKIGLAIMDTYQAATAAYANALAIPGAGLALAPIAAALAVASGLANIAMIRQTDVGGGGGGGGGGGLPASSAESPAPEMMSGAFELTGGKPAEPLQAYVVSDDITNNQNKLAIIRRRATI